MGNFFSNWTDPEEEEIIAETAEASNNTDADTTGTKASEEVEASKNADAADATGVETSKELKDSKNADIATTDAEASKNADASTTDTEASKNADASTTNAEASKDADAATTGAEAPEAPKVPKTSNSVSNTVSKNVKKNALVSEAPADAPTEEAETPPVASVLTNKLKHAGEQSGGRYIRKRKARRTYRAKRDSSSETKVRKQTRKATI